MRNFHFKAMVSHYNEWLSKLVRVIKVSFCNNCCYSRVLSLNTKGLRSIMVRHQSLPKINSWNSFLDVFIVKLITHDHYKLSLFVVSCENLQFINFRVINLCMWNFYYQKNNNPELIIRKIRQTNNASSGIGFLIKVN